LVVAQLIFCIKKDEHANGKTNTQSKDLNDGKSFVSPKIPESSFEIIFDHGYTLVGLQMPDRGNENVRIELFL